MKYSASILEVGENVNSMLQSGLLILFNQSAPAELRSYCVITDDNHLVGQVEKGDTFMIVEHSYIITAIGELANENLYSLGHVSLCFDGADKPKLPGYIHLKPRFQSTLSISGKIMIK